MSEFDSKLNISGEEFSLESILAEYKADSFISGEDARSDSRRIVIEAAQAVASASFADGPIFSGPAVDASTQSAEHDTQAKPGPEDGHSPTPEPESRPEPSPEPESEPEFEAEEIREEPAAEYAASDFARQEEVPDAGDTDTPFAGSLREKYSHLIPERSLAENIMASILGLIGAIAGTRRQRAAADPEDAPPPPDRDESIPEMPAEKAARFYASQTKAFRTRTRIAFVLTALCIYISFAFNSALPLAGALGSSIRVCALMCLIIQLAVMLTGLDVFTAGMTSLLRGSPAAESLCALSCLGSVLDTVVIAATGESAFGLPFCAVSCLSVLFGLWASRMNCSALRISFFTAARAKNPYIVSAESDDEDSGSILMKFRAPADGFVRRSEEPDICEKTYLAAAPILIVACLVFTVVASAKGQLDGFFHILSALLAVSASLSSLVSFALPYSVAAKRLFRSGAAVAGWRGCEEVGRSRQLVVTDADIFPAGTLGIESIRIIEGAFTDSVISCTGSVLAASGCALAASFTDLMRRSGYTMRHVENFSGHEGGGFVAYVGGDRVCVGSMGFMQLMGVRLPRKAASKTTLFTAVNGSLVGFFSIRYTPVSSVQDALVSMLRGRKAPLFAIRDMNITPLLIKQKFKIPAEGLDFPSFADRFALSAKQPDENTLPAAVLSREGLAPMAEISETGSRLYRTSRLCTLLSLLGSVLGVLVMFFLCWTKSYDAASVSNAVSFMLLWFVPVLALTFGLTK